MPKGLEARPNTAAVKLNTGLPEGYDPAKALKERQEATQELLSAAQTELNARLVVYNQAHLNHPLHIHGNPIAQYGSDKETVIRYELADDLGNIVPAICYWHLGNNGNRRVFVDVLQIRDLHDPYDENTYHLDQQAGKGDGRSTNFALDTNQPLSTSTARGKRKTSSRTAATQAPEVHQQSTPNFRPSTIYRMFGPESAPIPLAKGSSSSTRTLSARIADWMARMDPWWLSNEEKSARKNRGT